MNDPDAITWPVCPKCRSSVMLCLCATGPKREPVLNARPTDGQLLSMRNRIEQLEMELASACDAANTFARSIGVKECLDPFGRLQLRDLIDRLHSRSNELRIEALRK